MRILPTGRAGALRSQGGTSGISPTQENRLCRGGTFCAAVAAALEQMQRPGRETQPLSDIALFHDTGRGGVGWGTESGGYSEEGFGFAEHSTGVDGVVRTV